MSIREKIAEKPSLAAGSAVALILVTAVVLYQELWNTGPGRLKAFYTDDDGKTWFKDDLRKLTPFDHGGNQAFRVQVFRCGGGPPFIGWMEAYSNEELKNLQSASAQDDLALATVMSSYQPQVKHPGDIKWVTTRNRVQYEAITTPKCPDGSRDTPQPIGTRE